MKRSGFTAWLWLVIFILVLGIGHPVLSGQDIKSPVQLDFGPRLYLYNFYGIIALGENKVCAVGNSGTIIISEDGGKNWQIQKSGVDTELFDVRFSDSQKGWAVGREGTILRTDDGGKSWYSLKSPLETTLLSLSVVDENNIWAVGEWGTILHSADGKTWEIQNEKVDKIYQKVFFTDSMHGWIAGEFGVILHTEDGGTNWKPQINPLENVTLFSIFFKDTQTGWITGMDGHILSTDNGGAKWTELKSPTTKTMFDINVIGNTGWAFGLEGTYILSKDGGITWDQGRMPNFSWLTSSTFSKDGKCWVAGGNGTIWFTEDGQNWQSPLKLSLLSSRK
ncbi:MAG: hypothetical protein KJ826_06580 [Proteobacteria bacterium]|nr:hypothetical protein [Pseudomonadota bacterium]MBU4035446.1 hypothetical protein [Pseudomonadota bacterium]